MAGNLIQAGHRLRVWNRSPRAAEELARKGAEVVAKPGEAFDEVLISMLADDTAVREVVLDSGMLDRAARGGIHVNMATISVALTEELTEEHHRRGLHYIAAPVFGRPEAAAARQLNIVAAGEGAALDRVQPLLDAMGQRTWRLGAEPKEASAAKLAGNFLIAAAIECMGEAVVMVERYGVRPAAFLEILGNTLFAAPVYRNYGALIADRRYEPAGFRLELGLKDVRLALAAAESARTPMPVASLLRDHLLEAVAQGDGQRDWSALAEVARRHAGEMEPARH
jgi:3-hydroxyisobutyrate dehydrogenase-like beta-hydroxyacid dehydrogenase